MAAGAFASLSRDLGKSRVRRLSVLWADPESSDGGRVQSASNGLIASEIGLFERRVNAV